MRRILCVGLGLALAAGLFAAIGPAEAAPPISPGITSAAPDIPAAPDLFADSIAESIVIDLACVAAPATTMLPARVELPAGYRVTTPVDTFELGRLDVGTVLSRKVVTREPMRVPIDTGACSISHIPYSPIGQIDWFRV